MVDVQCGINLKLDMYGKKSTNRIHPMRGTEGIRIEAKSDSVRKAMGEEGPI